MSKQSLARARGIQYQGSVADRIAGALGLDRDDVRPGIGAETGMDVKLTKRARKLFPFAVECKNCKTLSIPAWIRQTKKAAQKEGLKPALVFRVQPSTISHVVLELEDFLELVKGANNGSVRVGNVVEGTSGAGGDHPRGGGGTRGRPRAEQRWRLPPPVRTPV